MSYYEFHVAKRYVQFEGALNELSKYAAPIGKKLLILLACDPIKTQVEAALRDSFSALPSARIDYALARESPRYAGWLKSIDRLDELASALSYALYDIGDMVVCESNVRKVAEYASVIGADTVVGIGGGKGMDFARALTRFAQLKVILVPTLAATNASASPLSVIYTEDGARILEYWRMDYGPELVLADTGILIKNGANALAAGVGDILCAYLEAKCNLALGGREAAFPAMSVSGLDIAVEIMFEQAPKAITAVRENCITPEFESVLSMILHNCGPLWMACTSGYAHIADEMLLVFEQARRVMHGLRVGMAALAMLRFQNADSAFIYKYRGFCKHIGIPTSLSQIGLSGISRRALLDAFERASANDSLNALPFKVTRDELVDSILALE